MQLTFGRMTRGARLAVNHVLPIPDAAAVRVRHGVDGGTMGGPNVKLARMSRRWPDTRWRYNLVYNVSGRVPLVECQWAQRRGVPVVAHVNSLFHAAYRDNWEALNAPAKAVYQMADHVVFGSDFAREAAEQFWGPPPGNWTRIYNALDVAYFRPPAARPPERFHVLVAGVQYIRHRLEAVIRAMPCVLEQHPEARLLIAGPLRTGRGVFDCDKETIGQIIEHVGIGGSVDFLGPYTQEEAPEVYAQGDVFVNLKHMDWTPNTVAEAMACGLPVVYSDNGGMHELAGASGVPVDVPADWHAIHTPEPEAAAGAILRAWAQRETLGPLARQIAAERFAIEGWYAAHQALFESLLNT